MADPNPNPAPAAGAPQIDQAAINAAVQAAIAGALPAALKPFQERLDGLNAHVAGLPDKLKAGAGPTPAPPSPPTHPELAAQVADLRKQQEQFANEKKQAQRRAVAVTLRESLTNLGSPKAKAGADVVLSLHGERLTVDDKTGEVVYRDTPESAGVPVATWLESVWLPSEIGAAFSRQSAQPTDPALHGRGHAGTVSAAAQLQAMTCEQAYAWADARPAEFREAMRQPEFQAIWRQKVADTQKARR
jgi:hypothetical protein